MHHELLVDAANSIFAVNCEVQGTTLHCGALYIDPLMPFQSIRLADSSASIEIELPEELLNQPSAIRAWEIPLNIRSHDQVLQRPVRG